MRSVSINLARTSRLATVLVLSSGAVALAAGGPALTPRSAYSGGSSSKGKVSVTLVASSATHIIGSPSQVSLPLGASFAFTGMFLHCTKIKLSNGSPSAVGVPVPAITLTKTHGSYQFSKSYRRRNLPVLGSLKTVTAIVTITGTVKSGTLIKGLVSIKGGACGAGAEQYSAKLDPTLPVSPNV
jgi:hypothetical protein